MNTEGKIKKALKKLGIQSTATYRPVTNHPAETRYEVQVSGKSFGIFDTEKETFVD